MSRQGSIKIITAILMRAPRLMSRQMLRSSSIRLIRETPTVAAKKVSPLDKIDWLQVSTEIWAAFTALCPFRTSSRNRVVIKMA